jgi:hypothetical protein
MTMVSAVTPWPPRIRTLLSTMRHAASDTKTLLMLDSRLPLAANSRPS